MSVLLREFNMEDNRLYNRALSLYNAVYNKTAKTQATDVERIALVRAIRETFLDDTNHKRPFNLRIARRFDSAELDAYEAACKTGYRRFFDTTVNTADGSFYLGFNHG